MKYYAYMRVSTIKQDTLRQREAILSYVTEKCLESSEIEFYTDYFTGKTFDRKEYQNMKSKMVSGDYLIVKEVDRLGRDWDGIKSEWKELQDMGVKIIIIDTPILSDALPNEKNTIDGLDLRLIKEQILSLMCYTAQKEREKISQRIKESLAQKKIHGTKTGNPIGRPRSEYITPENFAKTLRYMIDNNTGQEKASYKMNYPASTFKRELRRLYEEFKTTDYKEILRLYIAKYV